MDDPRFRAADLAQVMAGPPGYAPDDTTAFWMPHGFNGGMTWVGRFEGRSPWERHPEADEFVYTLEGEVVVTVMADAGPVEVPVPAGSTYVVPRGHWHRVEAAAPVLLMGATAGVTEHSEAEDPRAEAQRPDGEPAS